MKEEKISVIVPVYHVQEFLDACVLSLMKQTYANLEIILVDDGSDDCCPFMCDEYAETDNRIKVIHKKNGGLSDARNAGIEAATGKYLFFVDSDDYLADRAVMVLYRLLCKYNADIAIGSYKKVWGSGETEAESGEVSAYAGGGGIADLYREHFDDCVIACGKLYRSSAFAVHRFPLGKYHEDEFVTYKLLYESSEIVHTSDNLYYYRQREGSIMHDADSVTYRDAFEMAQECIVYFAERDKQLYRMAVSRALFLTKVMADKWNELGKSEKKQECLQKYLYFYRQYGHDSSLPLLYKWVYCLYSKNDNAGRKFELLVRKLERGIVHFKVNAKRE